MTRRPSGRSRALSLLLAGTLIPSPAPTADPSPAADTPAAGAAQLAFEPNRGQFEAEFPFVALGPGYQLGIAHGRATWLLPARDREVRLELRLANARPGTFATDEPLASRSHYARGRDPRAWHMDVPHFAALRETGVYPGVDLVYRAQGSGVEYDFVVGPGADAKVIRLRFEGAKSARIDARGDLLLSTAAGEMRHARPVAFQEQDSRRREIRAAYVRRGSDFGIELGRYDRGRTVVIDPVVSYSSFIGTAGWDEANDVAVDSSGNAYVVGGATRAGWKDVVVTKVGPGGHLVYRTFLSGAGGNPESANAVAVDAAGNAYLTGWSSSWDFPLKNHIQFYGEGDQDAFATKLDPAGAVVYSTYLGGSGEDHGSGIAVDSAGQAYVVGWTNSPNFPIAAASQPDRRGAEDAWVTKLSADGSRLVFSTYLGGTGNEAARGVAVHPTTGVHVVGRTSSTDFPVLAPMQSAYGGGGDDAFVTRLDPASGALASSTYRGGADSESAMDIALDSAGAVYVTGWAARVPAQGLGFVEKLAPQAASLVYSTYGRGGDAVVVDAAGNAFATGARINLSFDKGYYAPSGDAFFFSKLSSTGAPVLDFGGTGGLGLALNGAGELIVVGRTVSTLFPTWHAFQPAYAGDAFKLEGFVTKIAPDTMATASIEETDARVAYTGTWATDTTGSWSGGSGRRSSTAASTATLAFNGTGVQLLGRRGPGGGRLRVSVDAAGPYQNLDLPLAATALEPRALLLSITGLTSGAHTLRLEVVGDGTVWIDGFNVETGVPTPPPTATPTPTPRVILTPTPTPTAPPSATPTPTATMPPTATPTPTDTPPPTVTPPPTMTPTPTATLTATPPLPPLIRYEDDAAQITYTGSWFTNGSTVHSGSGAHLSVDPGDRATLTFTGTGVSLIGYQDEWSGIGRIWLDGAAVATVDFYRTPSRAQAVLYSASALASGTHTIAVEVTGTRNAASSGNWVWIDAFDVTTGEGGTPTATPTPTDPPPPTSTPTPTATPGPTTPPPTVTPTPTTPPTAMPTSTPTPVPTMAPTATPTPTTVPTVAPTATPTPTPSGPPPGPTRYEDTHAAVAYTGSWFTNGSTKHSASSARLSVDPGDRATFTFTGTAVTLIGYQDEWAGIGRVYVDGVLRGTVDFYRTPWRAQAPLFTASGLSPGTHTIAVEVTGTRNAASASNWIWIDAFDVTL